MSARPPNAAIAAEDLSDFDRLYEDYFDFVWKSARRLGVSDAALEDAAQETFVIVHKKLHEFEGRATFRTWLFAIVRNVARDARRTERRKSPPKGSSALDEASALVASPESRPDHRAERSAENRALYALLDELDEEKREVFVLAELEQFAVTEIAEALSINLNTAYSRLRLAREAFAKAAARFRAKEKGSP